VLIAFDGDSSIRGSSESTGGFIDNNNKGVRLGSFPANVWIKVKVTYEKSDPSTVGISYWVDDEFKGKDSLPSLSFENDLVYFSATTGEGTVWFDDIRVTPKSSSAGNGGEGDILYCSCQEGK
jgi:hypothetical protein